MSCGNSNSLWEGPQLCLVVRSLASHIPSSKITAQGWLFLTPPTTSASLASVPLPPLGPCPCAKTFPTQKQPLQEQRRPNTSTAQRKPASHVPEHKIFPSLRPSPLTLHVIPSDPVKRTDSCYYTATAALRKLGSTEVSLPVPNHPSE